MPEIPNVKNAFLNSIRYTYVLVDISTFLITPITKNHVGAFLTSQN
jgi:hypothetical protein